MSLILALPCLFAVPTYAHAQKLDSCARSGNSLWDAMPKEGSGPTDKMTRIRDAMHLYATDFNNVLTAAVWFGYSNIIARSLQDKTMIKQHGPQSLYLAASMGRLHDTALMLQAGISANAETNNRLTPLYGAAEHGCVGAMQLLVDHGANINHKADVTWTLLEDAVLSRQFEAARFLMHHGYILRAGEDAHIRNTLTRMGETSAIDTIFGTNIPPTASGSIPTNSITIGKYARVCGVLTTERHFGAPNFGEDPKTDSNFTTWVLKTTSPVTVLTQSNPKHNTVTHRVQLYFKNSDDGARRLGKELCVEGAAAAAVTPGDIAPVNITVKSANYN